MRHETFHLKLIRMLLICVCDSPCLSFNFPILCLLCRSSAVLENLNSLQHLFHDILCPLAPACSSSSIWVPFSASHSPSISCTISEFHPAYLFFLPNRDLPGVALNFQICSTSISVLCILMASSCTYCPFHISYTDTFPLLHTPLRSMLRFLTLLDHENPLFF